MITSIKAVVTDIDKTLTKKGGDLPAVTIQAFQKLHEQGIKVGLATGREIDSTIRNQGMKWGLGFEFDFVIGMNGGALYNLRTDTTWEVPFMSSEHVYEIMIWMKPLIEKYKFAVNAEGGNNRSVMYLQGELVTFEKRHGYALIDKTGDYEGFCKEPTFKILFRAKPEQEVEVRTRFLSKFNETDQLIGTYPGTVEAMPKGFDKGTTLKKYAQEEGIDLSEIIAFGDSENDNSLLKMAGWGVCLKDGSVDTKECADDITEYSYLDAGVGRYLYDHYINVRCPRS
ncbi:MAG: HAD family hydrolase [Lachnospiraceae bacterium]|nr:HAD family hydrolase [Lachnospiraceae bacterium]